MNEAEVNKQIKSVGQKATELGDKFTSAGKKLTAGLTLPIVAFGAVAIKNASDLEETINKIDVIFGKDSKEIQDWGKTAITSFGMAQQTALDSVALFGDMATAMGLNTKEAKKLGKQLTARAGDLASFKNISQDVAKTALAAIFTGETESLKKLGVVMTEANLQQYALSKGYKTKISEMTQAEKVMLRYNFVMDMTNSAEGDFQRTSDGTANTIRVAQETFKELTAELGENLLPIVNKVLGKVNEWMLKFESLDEDQQNLILTILGIAAAIGPLLIVIGSLTKGIGLASSAISLFASNPTLLAIAALAVGIGVIVTQVLKLVNALKQAKAVAESFKTFQESVSAKMKEQTATIKEVGTTEQQKEYIDLLQSQLNAAVRDEKRHVDLYNSTKRNNPLGFLFQKSNLQSNIDTAKANSQSIRDEIKSMGGVPRYETGTNYVPRDGLAYLHEGEKVVPKKYNTSANGSSYEQGIVNNFNIDNMNIRNDKDIELVAEQLFYLQKKAVI